MVVWRHRTFELLTESQYPFETGSCFQEQPVRMMISTIRSDRSSRSVSNRFYTKAYYFSAKKFVIFLTSALFCLEPKGSGRLCSFRFPLKKMVMIHSHCFIRKRLRGSIVKPLYISVQLTSVHLSRVICLCIVWNVCLRSG